MLKRSLVTSAALALVTALAFPAEGHAQSPLPQVTKSPTAAEVPGRTREPLISDEQVRKAISDISKLAELEAERKTVPDDAYFSRDKIDVDREITGHLNELATILRSSESIQHWRDMRARQRELAKTRNDIDRLTQEAQLDPGKRPELMQQVEAAQKAAEDLRNRASTSKRLASEALQKAGVDLSEGQLDALTATVVGDDIVDLVTRVTNLGTVLERLREAVEKGTGGAEAQRRYYGAVVVVHKIALGAQRRYLEKIEGQYLPFVEGVITSATKASEEAQSLKRGETNPDRLKVLDANLKAQKITSDTARLYKQQLEGQRNYARSALADLERTVSVAINTRDTVQISLDLLATMDASQDLFRVIQTLKLPSIQPFNSAEVERAFERLTQQMAGY
jgi:hypothetical protein